MQLTAEKEKSEETQLRPRGSLAPHSKKSYFHSHK